VLCELNDSNTVIFGIITIKMDTSQAYSAVKSPFAKLWLLLKPHKKDLVSIYILAFFNGLIMLSIPLGIQTITNFLMTGQVSTSWVVMVIVVLIGVGLAYYIQVFQIKFVESLRQKIFLFSVFEIGSLMPKWKMESIDGRYAPEMVNRFFDILNIQGKLAKILIDFSLALFQVVFGLLLLTLYNGQFAFITLLSIVYFGVLLRATFKKGLITSKEESEHKYATAAWIEEGARSLETVKLASGNHMFLQKINDITTQYLQARTSHFSVLLRQYNGLIWYKILVIAILLILGGLLVINQQINIGQFVAAEITIITIISSLEKILLSVEHIYDVLVSVDKVRELTTIELETSGDRAIESETGLEIDIRDLRYKFEDNVDFTLNGIDLHIQPNEKICITGDQSSGKSLLLYILASFYQDYEGTVSVNGISMRHIHLDALRDMIAENISKAEVLEHTLRENITLGKPFSDAALTRILQQTGLATFAEQLPQGVDTELMTEDKRLTKSVRMKIKLARCLAKSPRLILFEDSLGRIDQPQRDAIRSLFLEKSAPWTLIAVCSNPDHLHQYDRVIYMRNGRIEKIVKQSA